MKANDNGDRVPYETARRALENARTEILTQMLNLEYLAQEEPNKDSGALRQISMLENILRRLDADLARMSKIQVYATRMHC
jgi:hypothetical protein